MDVRNLELPVAPEGYFWRVSDGPLGGFFPWVQLRKKWWVFSHEVDAIWQSEKDFETVEDEIKYLCRRLLQRYHRRNYLTEKALERMGDYGKDG